ncbi:uncharacterized protein (DUF885 family) [Tamaricihabitans halophyticus]|uniref:Uncharacterized protein (DUF885 family) n=1 Tax=Tamaricihabitans halophyticus TaxID=1262583 RepID=A0A4R2R594_9PSEU|nr:DUF885 domain-containing protein [Tamaricihabitans halophyticus]TCP56959.1 uncharacterized protein (DUF885 family) [Tamaricihabitans halophyticus]
MTDQPDTVATLGAQLQDAQFTTEPIGATLLGVPGYDDQLGDPSAAAEAEIRARLVDIRDRARALPAQPADAVSHAVLLQQAEAAIEQLDARLTEYTIAAQFWAPATRVAYLAPMAPLSTAQRARDYLARLAGIPDYLTALAERHREGLAAGRTPIAHLVRGTIDYFGRYLAAPQDDPFTKPRPQEGDPAAFANQRDQLLSELVRPAFANYCRVLAEEIEPHARDKDRTGLCWLPDGEASYAAMIRVHTTTERTADELHQTGLDIIAGLTEEYAEVGERVFGTRDQAEIFRRLREDPALRWSNAAEILAGARKAIEKAEAEAPRWFGRLPVQRCQVEAIPDSEAPGAPAAYYVEPALDGTRPGTYFANTHLATERDRFTSEVIAFHEAVPGHHFQLSLAGELTELPLFRKTASVNAYTEGWGLYSERLADEMGLYSSDLDRLGMLAEDSLRAARLVADTGLHAKGWTRQQTVDFMVANTPTAQVDIESEVDRYMSYPGQALAYMVGRLEIQRARARAEERLGARFDIRAFHDLVLGNGPLPLTVLHDQVAAWTP